MKKTLILIVPILLLTGCSYKNDDFSKKQDCAKLTSQLETKILQKNDSNTNSYKIEQVFYSSKLSTCAVAYSFVRCYPNYCLANYAIEDALTGEAIFNNENGDDKLIGNYFLNKERTTEGSIGYEKFNEKIKELKK